MIVRRGAHREHEPQREAHPLAAGHVHLSERVAERGQERAAGRHLDDVFRGERVERAFVVDARPERDAVVRIRPLARSVLEQEHRSRGLRELARARANRPVHRVRALARGRHAPELRHLGDGALHDLPVDEPPARRGDVAREHLDDRAIGIPRSSRSAVFRHRERTPSTRPRTRSGTSSMGREPFAWSKSASSPPSRGTIGITPCLPVRPFDSRELSGGSASGNPGIGAGQHVCWALWGRGVR